MAERPWESAPEGFVTSPTRLPFKSAKFDFSSSSMPRETAARAAPARFSRSRLLTTAANRKGCDNIIFFQLRRRKNKRRAPLRSRFLTGPGLRRRLQHSCRPVTRADESFRLPRHPALCRLRSSRDAAATDSFLSATGCPGPFGHAHPLRSRTPENAFEAAGDRHARK